MDMKSKEVDHKKTSSQYEEDSGTRVKGETRERAETIGESIFDTTKTIIKTPFKTAWEAALGASYAVSALIIGPCVAIGNMLKGKSIEEEKPANPWEELIKEEEPEPEPEGLSRGAQNAILLGFPAAGALAGVAAKHFMPSLPVSQILSAYFGVAAAGGGLAGAGSILYDSYNVLMDQHDDREIIRNESVNNINLNNIPTR
jgi:hypothetical protein